MKSIFKVLAFGLIITLCSFASEWITVRNTAGKFSALFPRQPQESEESVKTEIGDIKMKTFMYEVGNFKDDNALYGVIYSDYPETLVHSDFKDEVLNEFFKGAIDGAVKNVKGETISVKNISINNYPGRDVKASFADGEAFMYMRMYIVKSRMYILEVACEKAKDNNGSIDKFMKSFALTGGK